MTVSNNFQPFAQYSRWQETNHKFFFSSSRYDRLKQNHTKLALWPSPPQHNSFLHFTVSNFGAILLQQPKEEKAGASPPTLEHCLGWGNGPLVPLTLSVGAHTSKHTTPDSLRTRMSDGKCFFREKWSLRTSSVHLGIWESTGLQALWADIWSKCLLRAKIYPFKPDHV